MIILNEQNKNQISYEENWNTVSRSEYPQTTNVSDEPLMDEEYAESENKIRKKKNNSPKQTLITLQLIICILIALIAFIIKSFGGELYAVAREWYYSQLNNSVIFDDKNGDFNLSEIFGNSTEDEI